MFFLILLPYFFNEIVIIFELNILLNLFSPEHSDNLVIPLDIISFVFDILNNPLIFFGNNFLCGDIKPKCPGINSNASPPCVCPHKIKSKFSKFILFFII